MGTILSTQDGNATSNTNGQPIMLVQSLRTVAFSATTPLGNAGVYTSPILDMINVSPVLRGRLFTDQNGSFVLYHSDDGITFDPATSTAYTGQITVGALTLTALSRYFKVVYTNGATPQTTFHFSLYLSPN